MDTNQLPEWDNYADTAAPSADPDKVERPPLTGKNRHVPEGLYDQPWDHVGDAYGKATLTPYYIEALTSDDAGDVHFGTYGLYSATTHQGSVYKSSQMAVPFLADLLTLDSDAAEMACHFLARIALGESHFIRSPAYFYKTKYYGSVKKCQKEILAYYGRTASLEAMRLLCFLPKALPDRIDFSYATALSIEKGNERLAYIRQASALMAQGFLAAERNFGSKGYPLYAAQIDPSALRVSAHAAEAGELMEKSPSLLVRGCAAVCLVFTGIVDRGILELLAFLGEGALDGVPWVWDESFSSMAKKAWFFASDLDTLAETDRFPTLDYTSKTKEGVETKHYSQTEVLTEAVCRAFPYKYTDKKEELPSLLPTELSEIQKKILRRVLEAAPLLFGSYTITGLNLPQTTEAAKRWLGESGEILCAAPDGRPLWFLLEQSLLHDAPGDALHALAQFDVWQMLGELYKPWGLSRGHERCTLNIKHYSEKVTAARETALQSMLANALAGYTERIMPFLDGWLEEIKNFTAPSDWGSKTPAQRIGIGLLALARAGTLEEKYYPLVRPYHNYPEYSAFPPVLLKEVLQHTSAAHREKIEAEFRIK